MMAAFTRRGPETVYSEKISQRERAWLDMLASYEMIGQRVRSFDFADQDIEGERACYVTGVVTGILKAGDLASDGETVFHDCDRYIIEAESRTFAGKPTDLVYDGQQFFPPLNGTPSWMGGIMNGVVPIE